MTIKEYWREAVSFRTHEANCYQYLHLGLLEEIGEVSGKLAKAYRDKVFFEKDFIKELGDVFWFLINIADYYCCEIEDCELNSWTKTTYDTMGNVFYLCKLAQKLQDTLDDTAMKRLVVDSIKAVNKIARAYGHSLDDVARLNLEKLRDRKARNCINGNGDNR